MKRREKVKEGSKVKKRFKQNGREQTRERKEQKGDHKDGSLHE
jgi:hypothetical protein